MHIPFTEKEIHPMSSLGKTWSFINLIVGNSKRYNCKKQGYRMKISLAVLTVYVLMFTTGLFAGDLFATRAVELEKLFGMISTGAVYTMGFSVLYEAFRRKKPLYYSSVLSVILVMTQTAFVFNLFPLQVQNIFYYVASLCMMFFVWFTAHRDRLDQLSKLKK